MSKSIYRYITQIMPLSEDYQNDDMFSYFPNIYEAILLSEPFDDYRICIKVCNTFLKDKVDEINSISQDKYGIVWECNPKYKTSILGAMTNEKAIDNTARWNLDELVKYHIVKLSDLKNNKNVSSLLVSTVTIEPGDIASISIH